MCGWCISASMYVHRQSHYTFAPEVIARLLPKDLTDVEHAIASQPGMYGRLWFGQGLAFDEAYQILQDCPCWCIT